MAREFFANGAANRGAQKRRRRVLIMSMAALHCALRGYSGCFLARRCEWHPSEAGRDLHNITTFLGHLSPTTRDHNWQPGAVSPRCLHLSPCPNSTAEQRLYSRFKHEDILFNVLSLITACKYPTPPPPFLYSLVLYSRLGFIELSLARLG